MATECVNHSATKAGPFQSVCVSKITVKSAANNLHEISESDQSGNEELVMRFGHDVDMDLNPGFSSSFQNGAV